MAPQNIHVFLAGSGLIGSALLTKINAQRERLLAEEGIALKGAGIVNTKKMVLGEHLGTLSGWKEELNTRGQKADLAQFVAGMKAMRLPNAVFVDCTASEEIPALYNTILAERIAIVTPNKKGLSSNFKFYKNLKLLASQNHTRFLYETTVGAGLPVLSTIRDFMLCGDRVEKISAIVSGTLSYIFNSFEGNTTLSKAVREAQKLGYTEPDPRNDLNGMDAARKLVIVARECALPMECADVEIEQLIPQGRKKETVKEFLKTLERYDAQFEAKKQRAIARGAVLRFVAEIENGKAKMFLKEVASNHPFAGLRGSDNIFSFTTDHYHETPLIVRGKGAGAEVTSAGVFSDIFKAVRL